MSNPARRRILFLSSVHRTLDTRIVELQAQSLHQAGFQVMLAAPLEAMTVAPNWLRLIRLPAWRRRLWRVLGSVPRGLAIVLNSRPNIVQIQSPELAPLIAVLKLLGFIVIYDAVEDLLLQVRGKTYLPAILRKPLARLSASMEAMFARFADMAIFAEPDIGERLNKPNSILIENFPRTRAIQPSSVAQVDRNPSFAYVGALSRERGLFQMMAAVARLSAQDVKLILAGSMQPDELVREARSRPGWHRTQFLGWQDRADVAQLLQSVRAGLCILHPTEKYVRAYPVKLYEYMAAGLPVIASDFPRWRAIVERARCGLLVDPMNVEQITEAMRWILEHPEDAEHMGRNGRAAVEASYSWENQEARYLSIYRSLLKS